jgi:mannose-6-phosphate isomerase-like protein (cupin superfamily)
MGARLMLSRKALRCGRAACPPRAQPLHGEWAENQTGRIGGRRTAHKPGRRSEHPGQGAAEDGFRATLSTRIAAPRKEQGLSVTALATAADVSSGASSHRSSEVRRCRRSPRWFESRQHWGRRSASCRRADPVGRSCDGQTGSDTSTRTAGCATKCCPPIPMPARGARGLCRAGRRHRGRVVRHGAITEFLLVLEGRIELWVGDEVHLLEKGQRHDLPPGTMRHGYVNRWDASGAAMGDDTGVLLTSTSRSSPSGVLRGREGMRSQLRKHRPGIRQHSSSPSRALELVQDPVLE